MQTSRSRRRVWATTTAALAGLVAAGLVVPSMRAAEDVVVVEPELGGTGLDAAAIRRRLTVVLAPSIQGLAELERPHGDAVEPDGDPENVLLDELARHDAWTCPYTHLTLPTNLRV